ncbi:MAG: dTDP-4-dehydrorhamnose reductase [Desulfuromonadales bacterium]|nr:dTDP-4-dehydrorhamnose reductase [Desulfuromonadales bacterium]
MTNKVRKIVVIGANGMLAQKVIEAADSAAKVICLDLPEFDITDRVAVLHTIEELCPDVIINCAAYTQVDKCETEEALAFRVNGEGPGFLAEAAKECDAVLVHISTDYVFAGDSGTPYREDDPVGPLSVYGRSKLKGERAIIASGLLRYFILRTSWLYGPGGPNFVETVLRLAAEREELRIVSDQIGSPTYTGDLARAIFALLQKSDDGRGSIYGIYHFSGDGACSWYDFASVIVARAQAAGIPLRVKTITPITTADYPLPAIRPAYSVFNKSKYQTAVAANIPQWQQSLQIYLDERQAII